MLHLKIVLINDEHAEAAENMDNIMPMYNLIEYCENYSDSSGRLYQFKKDESPMNNDGNLIIITLKNSSSFKYKVILLAKATDVDGAEIEIEK